jgi:hypothetical protein
MKAESALRKRQLKYLFCDDTHNNAGEGWPRSREPMDNFDQNLTKI